MNWYEIKYVLAGDAPRSEQVAAHSAADAIVCFERSNLGVVMSVACIEAPGHAKPSREAMDARGFVAAFKGVLAQLPKGVVITDARLVGGKMVVDYDQPQPAPRKRWPW